MLKLTMFTVLAAGLTGACFAPGEPGVAESGCPHLQVKQSEAVPAGTLAQVGVSLVGARPLVTYQWTVTEGTIVRGQGSDTILIDTSGLAGKTLRADVELGGLSPTCVTRGASTFILVGPAVSTSKR
ncbi:MAG: hypothetical protein JNL83_16160 [Myxococcales bacterium]|nr:hypothetical protein [Myxococcales bacterium]